LKLLLDTTYFLPAIGISVKNLPKNAVIKLIQEGHEIFINSITIFELSAKGAKYVAAGKIPAERVVRGIKAIAYDETINIIEMHESTILPTALKLRKILKDFTDCLILSSAINQCDALITEDEDIHKIKENKTYLEIITKARKPKFKIQSLMEVHIP